MWQKITFAFVNMCYTKKTKKQTKTNTKHNETKQNQKIHQNKETPTK